MGKDKDIIEMAITNFDNIRRIAERLSTGNVAHDSRTIMGIAMRNAKYLNDYLAKRQISNQWRPISELKKDMNADKIWVKTEIGNVFRIMDDYLDEKLTHFMIVE